MSKKIIVSTISDLSYDQRIQKVCNSLDSFGYDLEIIHTNLRRKSQKELSFKNQRINLIFQKNFLIFIEFNLRLFFVLLFKKKKQVLLLANDLDALLPNVIIAKIFGLKLVYDSHEIFTELPSLKDKKNRKGFWEFLEKNLINHVDAMYTVSHGYCDWFKKEYGIKSDLIGNFPRLKNYQSNGIELFNKPLEPIVLYQGALNPGRGLKYAIQAMEHLENAELWIAGEGPIKKQLHQIVADLNLENKVRFLGLIKPEELRSITKQASVGLSLEEDLGLSYRYALPNKLFDYVHSGVPVLTTYLPEIKRVVQEFEIGESIETHNPKHIAEKLGLMLNREKDFYKNGLLKAAENFTWEKQEEKLKSIYQSLMEQK